MPHRTSPFSSCLRLALAAMLHLAFPVATRAQVWSDPVVLETGPANHLEPFNSPQVVINGAGAALATFEHEGEEGKYHLYAAARLPGPGPAGSRWQPAVRLSRDQVTGPASVAISESGTGIVVWNEPDGWAATCEGGNWSMPVRLGQWSRTVSMDASGKAMVLGAANGVPTVTRYTPGVGWSEPAPLGIRPEGPMELRVAPNGHARAVFQRDGKVWSLAFDPERGWGKPCPFHPAGPGSSWSTTFVELGLGPDGHAVASLADRSGCEEPGATGYAIQVHDFSTRATTRLDQFCSHDLVFPSHPLVVMGGAGQAMCAWVLGTLKAARFEEGQWGAPVTLGVPGEPNQPDAWHWGWFDVAMAPGGTALIVYGQALESSPGQTPLWSQVYWPEDAARACGLLPGWQPPVRMSPPQADTKRPAVAMNDWMAVAIYFCVQGEAQYTVAEWQQSRCAKRLVDGVRPGHPGFPLDRPLAGRQP